jgi:hypothetical protein
MNEDSSTYAMMSRVGRNRHRYELIRPDNFHDGDATAEYRQELNPESKA